MIVYFLQQWEKGCGSVLANASRLFPLAYEIKNPENLSQQNDYFQVSSVHLIEVMLQVNEHQYPVADL